MMMNHKSKIMNRICIYKYNMLMAAFWQASLWAQPTLLEKNERSGSQSLIVSYLLDGAGCWSTLKHLRLKNKQNY